MFSLRDMKNSLNKILCITPSNLELCCLCTPPMFGFYRTAEQESTVSTVTESDDDSDEVGQLVFHFMEKKNKKNNDSRTCYY